MKLRNKKTGEVAEVSSCNSASGKIRIYYDKEDGKIGTSDSFSSLAELNEWWEDYKPAEPLIKDEKIRKAVRAWAEALDIDEVYINYIGDNTYIELYEDPARNGGWNRMSLPNQKDIKKNERYTIAELCGEEDV